MLWEYMRWGEVGVVKLFWQTHGPNSEIFSIHLLCSVFLVLPCLINLGKCFHRVVIHPCSPRSRSKMTATSSVWTRMCSVHTVQFIRNKLKPYSRLFKKKSTTVLRCLTRWRPVSQNRHNNYSISENIKVDELSYLSDSVFASSLWDLRYRYLRCDAPFKKNLHPKLLIQGIFPTKYIFYVKTAQMCWLFVFEFG